MSRTTLNFFLDVVLFAITSGLLFTSAVVRLVFPPPTSADGWTLWGFSLNAWANAQFVLTCLIGLAILVHIMLHWSWVCGVVTTRLLGRKGADSRIDDGTRTLYGVAMLIAVLAVLGVLLGLCTLMVQPPPTSYSSLRWNRVIGASQALAPQPSAGRPGHRLRADDYFSCDSQKGQSAAEGSAVVAKLTPLASVMTPVANTHQAAQRSSS